MQDANRNLFFGHTIVTLPYVVRTTTASLLLVDRSLEQAARTLGANPWRTFRRATLPQIVPGIAAGALFAFMVSLDNYPISMWLSDARAVPLPILLYKNMTRVLLWKPGAVEAGRRGSRGYRGSSRRCRRRPCRRCNQGGCLDR